MSEDRPDTLLVIPPVEPPGSVDPHQATLYQRRRRPALTPEEYVDGILRGDRAILGRAITLIESTRPRDEELAQEILECCLPHTGQTLRVGITGAPGAGKSTFIEALGTHLTRDRGERVAVLAVDPSSEFSGGSILGDKTRMEQLAADDRAFIRPSPARGSLGGVARRTRETMLLCEAAGFRNILVETVGVGQSETAVYAMVDFFLLLMLAGAGDELQGIKRGIIEMTDAIAINKADLDPLRAEQARRQFDSALHLFPPPASGWTPRVVTCSAITRQGIASLWEMVREHHAFTRGNGYFDARRRAQRRRWLKEAIEHGLREDFQRSPEVQQRLPALERAVDSGRLSPFRAAREVLDLYRSQRKG